VGCAAAAPSRCSHSSREGSAGRRPAAHQFLRSELWGRREEQGEKAQEKKRGEERKNRGEAGGEERNEKFIFVTDVLVAHVIIKIGAEKKGLLLELDPKNEAPNSWGSPYSLK
jgi:hypothetical protein